MEVLYGLYNNTSTDFLQNLSTKTALVEVVEIVEVPSYPCGDALFYDSEIAKSN